MGLDLYHFKPTPKIDKDNILEYLTLDDLAESPEYVARYATFLIDKNFEEYGIKKVIYFETKGYQRKGMSVDFFTDFKNDGIYFDLKSVTKAYYYLKADHISTLTELQNNFQNNFIDNFIEGESIFCVSW